MVFVESRIFPVVVLSAPSNVIDGRVASHLPSLSSLKRLTWAVSDDVMKTDASVTSGRQNRLPGYSIPAYANSLERRLRL